MKHRSREGDGEWEIAKKISRRIPRIKAEVSIVRCFWPGSLLFWPFLILYTLIPNPINQVNFPTIKF